MMGDVIVLDGRVTRSQPPGALALEAGCDWGWCDRPGIAWRWCAEMRLWLVVCARCVRLPAPR